MNDTTALQDHQARITSVTSAPEAVPATSPGVQFNLPAPEKKQQKPLPWWMQITGSALREVKTDAEGLMEEIKVMRAEEDYLSELDAVASEEALDETTPFMTLLAGPGRGQHWR